MIDTRLFGRGEYAGVLQKEFFLMKIMNPEAPNSQFKNAAEMAVVTVSEFEENDQPKSAQVKQATGNDEVPVRGMNENSSIPVPFENAPAVSSQMPASKKWSWPSLLPTTSILRR